MSDSKKKEYKVLGSHLDAFATPGGIFVSSTAFSDVQKTSAFTYYNDDGEIETKIWNRSIGITRKEYFNEHKEIENYLVRASVCTYVALFTILLILALLGNVTLIVYGLIFMIFAILTEAHTSFVNYVVDICYANYSPTFSKYHSAEHMASKALIKLGRVPTMEEIKQETRFDVNCTTVDTIVTMLTSLFDTFVLTTASVFTTKNFIVAYAYAPSVFLQLFSVIIVIVLIFALRAVLRKSNAMIIGLLKRERFLKLFQAPLLKEPSDRELAIAEEAFNTQYKMDKKIQENEEAYETATYYFELCDRTVVYELKNGEIYKSTLKEYFDFIHAIATAEKANPEETQEQNEEDSQ